MENIYVLSVLICAVFAGVILAFAFEKKLSNQGVGKFLKIACSLAIIAAVVCSIIEACCDFENYCDAMIFSIVNIIGAMIAGFLGYAFVIPKEMCRRTNFLLKMKGYGKIAYFVSVLVSFAFIISSFFQGWVYVLPAFAFSAIIWFLMMLLVCGACIAISIVFFLLGKALITYFDWLRKK